MIELENLLHGEEIDEIGCVDGQRHAVDDMCRVHAASEQRVVLNVIYSGHQANLVSTERAAQIIEK